MEPVEVGLIGAVANVAKEKISTSVIAQSLIVAAITASATGYVSAKVLEREVSYLIQEIHRIDRENDAIRLKVDEVALRQASVVGQAQTIHDNQNRRLERLEAKR